MTLFPAVGQPVIVAVIVGIIYGNNDDITGAFASVIADRFSARWTRTIHVTEDAYRFSTTSDDGIRVWMDNKLIIDEWHDPNVVAAVRPLATLLDGEVIHAAPGFSV